MQTPADRRGESRRDFLNKSFSVAVLSLTAGVARATKMPAARPARMLTVIASILYPHASLPASVYEGVSAALLAKADSDPTLRQMLDAGLQDLDRAAGGDWLALTPAAQLASLSARQETPFFQFVRGLTAFSLYSNPEVWKRFGYGGDAWSFGGYAGKSAGDIDWLPEPTVTP